MGKGCRLWARKSPEPSGSCSSWVWKGILEKEGSDSRGKHRKHHGETCSRHPSPLTHTRKERAGVSFPDSFISLEELIYKLNGIFFGKPGTSLSFPVQIQREQRLMSCDSLAFCRELLLLQLSGGATLVCVCVFIL